MIRLDGTLDDLRISGGPNIRPFVELDEIECPACGARKEYGWRRILRKLKGKSSYDLVTAKFCPGDKPPTEESRSIFWIPMETKNRCSGIPDAHLHVNCRRCHAEWFIATKEGLR